MIKKFLRRTWNKYSKLGKGRKKKQVWRRPRGRDNKMREKRRGYSSVVSVGYKKEERKSAVIVKNIRDLKNIKKQEIIIIGKIGKKKKIELVKKAKEMKIEFKNLNIKKFLKDQKVKKKETPPVEKIQTKEKLKKENKK